MFQLYKKNLLVLSLIFSAVFFSANIVQAVPVGDVADPDGFGTGLGGGNTSSSCALNNFKDLVDCINKTVINPLIALTVGIGLVVFLWGVVKYIGQSDKPEEKKKGLVIIGWGILGLFIMVSVWGLVNILTNTFFGGVTPSSPSIPTIPANL